MGASNLRVFYQDGRIAWGSFDPSRDEAGPVLWPTRAEAQGATSDKEADRFRGAETFGTNMRAVHGRSYSVPIDLAKCEPVAVESVVGGVAQWWTGLATSKGHVLATNLEANEVHVKERGLFRPHPDYLPSHIPVTGPAWEEVDWSDVDPEAAPATPGP